MKQDILEVYSDIFTGIGKFPSALYKFQLKQNVKPTRHMHLGMHSNPLTGCFPQGNQEFGTLRNFGVSQRGN